MKFVPIPVPAHVRDLAALSEERTFIPGANLVLSDWCEEVGLHDWADRIRNRRDSRPCWHYISRNCVGRYVPDSPAEDKEK